MKTICCPRFLLVRSWLGLVPAFLGGFLLASSSSAAPKESSGSSEASKTVKTDSTSPTDPKLETATFGGGCFWCVEAVLERLKGVKEVSSGYMGGHVDHPTYEQVCQKNTGHAEVVQVKFDPAQLNYADLLDVFFQSHDPTTLNRQGNDVGPQYRSVIFYHSPEQKNIAEQKKALIGTLGIFKNPVVTEITAASKFWEAEDYHQDYFRNNPGNGYCNFMIPPKLQKLGLDDKGLGEGTVKKKLTDKH